jgi:hypothetical protein
VFGSWNVSKNDAPAQRLAREPAVGGKLHLGEHPDFLDHSKQHDLK